MKSPGEGKHPARIAVIGIQIMIAEQEPPSPAPPPEQINPYTVICDKHIIVLAQRLTQLRNHFSLSRLSFLLHQLQQVQDPKHFYLYPGPMVLQTKLLRKLSAGQLLISKTVSQVFRRQGAYKQIAYPYMPAAYPYMQAA